MKTCCYIALLVAGRSAFSLVLWQLILSPPMVSKHPPLPHMSDSKEDSILKKGNLCERSEVLLGQR